MSSAFSPKVMAPGEGKIVTLFGVRFCYKIEALAPILTEHRTPPEYYQLAEDYGITIQDDWIPELERTYGVKL
jgi:hypothetical protein